MISCLIVLLILSIIIQGGLVPFSKDRTTLLKAVLPWVIILHHLSLKTNLLGDFNEAGVYVVGLFFFISGYGLEKKKVGEANNSIRQLPKRLSKLLWPLVVPVVLYLILVICFGGDVVGLIKNSLRDWCIILPYTWFILNLLIFYVVYYCLAHYIRDTKMFIILMAIALLIISMLLMLLDGTSAHYSSNFAFLAGIIYCHIEGNAIKTFATKKSVFVLMLIAVVATYFGTHPFRLSSSWNVPIYSIAVIALVSRIPFKNKGIDFMSKYSYDLYICQSIAFLILNKLFVLSDLTYIILALPLCFIIAIVCHQATKSVQQLIIQE